MTDSLLLSSSFIFDDSTLIDNIRQSCIDLTVETDDTNVKILLEEALSYLERDINLDLASEIISLILSCLSYNPDLFFSIFNSNFEKSRSNPYYIITTASMLSYLSRNKSTLQLSSYDSFISDSLREILPQIQISIDHPITVFNQEIPSQFKYDLVIDLLFSCKLTNELVSNFSPFIFSSKIETNPKIQLFINYLIKTDFIRLMPPEIIFQKGMIEKLSKGDVEFFISSLSDELFEKNLSQIDEILNKIIYAKDCRQLTLAILKRCQKLNLKSDCLLFVLSHLLPSDFTPDVIEFLIQQQKYVSFRFIEKLFDSDVPGFDFLLQIVGNPRDIPDSLIEKHVLTSKEWRFYDFLFNSPILQKYIDSHEFWIHLYSVYNDNMNYCLPLTFTLKCEKVAVNFLASLSDEKFVQFFDEVLFSIYPPSFDASQFFNLVLNAVDHECLKKFHSRNNMVMLLNKIIDKKITPNYSFMKLIDNEAYFDMLQKCQSPLLYYGYYVSNNSENKLKKITVINDSKFDNDVNFIEFIKTNDFKFICSLNEKMLSLVSCALLTSISKDEIVIENLTKENILPFYSIVFNNDLSFFCEDENLINKFFISPKISHLFEEGISYFEEQYDNDDSSVLRASVNSIIIRLDKFNDVPNKLSKSVKNQILELFSRMITKNGKLHDKAIIFKSFLNNVNYLNSNFQYIIHHLHEVELKSIAKKDLTIDHKISNLIIENIQSDSASSQLILNCINFISNVCNSDSIFKIENLDNLKKTFMKEDKDDNILLISKFMIKNNLINELRSLLNERGITQEIKNKINLLIPINERIIDELLSPILLVDDPENHNEPIEDLFKRMMNEKSAAFGHLHIFIEMMHDELSFTSESLMNRYLDKYLEYKEAFIEALSHLRVYHPEKKVFVKVAKFDDFDFSDCKFGISIINKLFDSIKEKKNYYQAFFCLLSIANTFPFLFALNPQQVFDLVLIELDNFSLLFEDNLSEEEQKKVKTTLSAYSFLISSLHSTQVLDAFMVWALTNIERFSNSQVFGLILALYSILHTKYVQLFLISNIIRYNFLDTLSNLIDRKIPEGLFSDNYYSYIYGFYNLFCNIVNSHLAIDAIVVDEYAHIDNPIYNEFDHYLSIYPYKLSLVSRFQYSNDLNKNLFDFLENINQKRSFWIDELYSNNHYHKYNREQISKFNDNFIDDYMKISNQPNEIKYPLLNIPQLISPLTVKMFRYILTKNTWLYQYILYKSTFPLFPEHCEMIMESINKMNEIKKTGKLDENDTTEDIELECFNTYEYYKPIVSNENIIRSFTNRMLVEKNYFWKNALFSKDSSALSLSLQILNKELTSSLTMKEISILAKFLSDIYNSYSNDKGDFNTLIAAIIESFLQPSLRCNEGFLLDFSECFINDEMKYLPIRITHLIGFLIKTKNDSCICQALKLCSKLNEEQLAYTTIVQDYFDQNIKGKHVSHRILYHYFKYYPSVIHVHQKASLHILKDLLEKEETKSQEDNNYYRKKIIIELLNNLPPKRNLSRFVMSDSNNDPAIKKEQSFSFNPIPKILWDLNPPFWNIFVKHRKIINEIVEGNIKECKLFEYYPEIFSFNFRTKYFMNQMEKRLNNSYLTIEVDRERIIESSFNVLLKKKTEEWLSLFYIKFIDEPGIDAGGLLKDWFTRITKELFNPLLGLFDPSGKNMSNQPNRLSYTNPNHLEYFKFAGMLIARALINGVCIDAYLTRPFLKQILHRDVCFKDLEFADEKLFQSFNYILENDIESNPLNEFYFEIDLNELGKNEAIQLIENGSNIKVNNENKIQYIELMSQFYLRNFIVDQINAFCEGFDALIPHEIIKIFTPNELSLLICGIPDIDIVDLRNNVAYEYPYDEKTPVVELFFSAISKWENEDLVKLLVFITGTSKVPITGFKHFKDMGLPIKIASGGDKSRFPVAHTCFNILDLPSYETEEELNSKFVVAMNQESFQLQ